MISHSIELHDTGELEAAEGGHYLGRFSRVLRKALTPLERMVAQKSAGCELRFVTEAESNIPDYQRSYSWRSAQVSDLLNDTFGRKSPYLMGAVILHETAEDLDKQNRVLNANTGFLLR